MVGRNPAVGEQQFVAACWSCVPMPNRSWKSSARLFGIHLALNLRSWLQSSGAGETLHIQRIHPREG